MHSVELVDLTLSRNACMDVHKLGVGVRCSDCLMML